MDCHGQCLCARISRVAGARISLIQSGSQGAGRVDWGHAIKKGHKFCGPFCSSGITRPCIALLLGATAAANAQAHQSEAQQCQRAGLGYRHKVLVAISLQQNGVSWQGLCAATSFQIDVWMGNTQLLKKVIAHVFVVVLTCMN